MKTTTWYVALYLVDKAYGGPEEGGWWYHTSEFQEDEFVQTFRTAEEAHDACRKLNLSCELEEMNEGRPEISSVASRGRYEWSSTEHPPCNLPKTRPHYE